MVSFDPFFDEDNSVSDMDLLSALCEVQSENNNNNNNQNAGKNALVPSTTPSLSNTNVLNNVPKSLFSNCNVTIGTINFYTKPN